MSSYKEIVTKAVIGKAKKSSKNDYTLETEEKPNTILGCWIINNTFNGSKNSDDILINGSFDVNVWYSYDNDTKTGVATRKINYEDNLKMVLPNNNSGSNDIIVKCLKQPTVGNVNIKDGIVSLTVEKEMGVEIVGDTKVKISVEEAEDDYEELTDITEDLELDELTDDYLNDSQ